MNPYLYSICLFVLCACGAHDRQSKLALKTTPKTPELGDKVDSLNGVYVFYNGSIDHTEGRNKASDGYNFGLKYQCVEFVKRYYYLHLKHKMPDTWGNAKDFFDAGVNDGKLNKKRNLLQFKNPSASKPKVNDLLIMDATTGNPYGHVCIVSKVSDEELEVVQQNPGPTAPSRDVYPLLRANKRYMVGGLRVLGWLRKKS
ncbi:MAG TPA: CHAP domain-containing protein [Flavobacteriales bacterium]|nr:CHAP domain-containing protein [Flavobacteriales bacterium]